MLLGDARAVAAGVNDLPKAFDGILGPRLLVRGLLDISQQLHYWYDGWLDYRGQISLCVN